MNKVIDNDDILVTYVGKNPKSMISNFLKVYRQEVGQKGTSGSKIIKQTSGEIKTFKAMIKNNTSYIEDKGKKIGDKYIALNKRGGISATLECGIVTKHTQSNGLIRLAVNSEGEPEGKFYYDSNTGFVIEGVIRDKKQVGDLKIEVESIPYHTSSSKDFNLNGTLVCGEEHFELEKTEISAAAENYVFDFYFTIKNARISGSGGDVITKVAGLYKIERPEKEHIKEKLSSVNQSVGGMSMDFKISEYADDIHSFIINESIKQKKW